MQFVELREDRIECLGTEFAEPVFAPIANGCAAQILDHPLSVNGALTGMVKNVDLPEAEQDLANQW
jgi:hypothetical protein